MNACRLKDVLECPVKDGAGSVAGFVIRFQDKTQETYIVLSPVKLQGVSHLGQLTLQL